MIFPKHLALAAIALTVICAQAISQENRPILFTNVNVFDGVNKEIIEIANVVVTDNLITDVLPNLSQSPMALSSTAAGAH